MKIYKVGRGLAPAVSFGTAERQIAQWVIRYASACRQGNFCLWDKNCGGSTPPPYNSKITKGNYL